MDIDTVDRLSRRIGTPGTRRTALGVLGSILFGGVLDAPARGKRHRRGKPRRTRQAKVTAHAGGAAQGAPVVIGPERETGLEENLIDCGAFMVHDRFDVTFTLRLYSDKEGTLVRGVEQVSGTDTFINAATGKELTGRFRNNVLIDFTSDPPLGANVGIIYKVTVPGAGAVFLDVGRLVTDRSGEIVAFQAGPHQFVDGDIEGLCAALA